MSWCTLYVVITAKNKELFWKFSAAPFLPVFGKINQNSATNFFFCGPFWAFWPEFLPPGNTAPHSQKFNCFSRPPPPPPPVCVVCCKARQGEPAPIGRLSLSFAYRRRKKWCQYAIQLRGMTSRRHGSRNTHHTHRHVPARPAGLQDSVCVSVPVCGARSVLPGPRLSLPVLPFPTRVLRSGKPRNSAAAY